MKSSNVGSLSFACLALFYRELGNYLGLVGYTILCLSNNANLSGFDNLPEFLCDSFS